MMRKHLVIAFLVGFCAGLLVRAGRSTAQSLPAYAVSVDTVMQRLQEHQDLFLVDVREERQFGQFRIPGSLNIPLFAVKTKAFLKTKPMVLVDEGYRPHQLAEVCEQLTQAGFEAHFLFGGLHAWRTRSANFNLLPLQGDVFAQKALNTMPPRALFAEREGKYWLLIDVLASGEAHVPGSAGVSPAPGNADILSTSDAGETPAIPDAGETPALPGALPEGDLFSQALSVPFDRDNPELFLTDLEHAVADAAVRSERFLVLIYNQYGEDYEQIERLLQNTDVNTVFFLEGGANAYTRFVSQQTQINQGQQNLTTTCSACAR